MIKKDIWNVRFFTLVELLLTISIIALLTAILLPALHKVREKARGSFCVSNLKELNTANLLYCSDYSYYMPCYGPEMSSPSSSVGKMWIGYRSARSGTEGNINLTKGFIYDISNNWKIMRCPSWQITIDDPERVTDGAGYGYNVMGIGSLAYITGSAYGDGAGMKVEKVKQPSETVTFGDVVAPIASGEIKPYSFFYPRYTISGNRMSINSRGDNAHFRHGAVASIGWADGHVSEEKPTRINQNFLGSAHIVGNFGPLDNSFFEPWPWTGAQ